MSPSLDGVIGCDGCGMRRPSSTSPPFFATHLERNLYFLATTVYLPKDTERLGHTHVLNEHIETSRKT